MDLAPSFDLTSRNSYVLNAATRAPRRSGSSGNVLSVKTFCPSRAPSQSGT
jgi:hypothetical protein